MKFLLENSNSIPNKVDGELASDFDQYTSRMYYMTSNYHAIPLSSIRPTGAGFRIRALARCIDFLFGMVVLGGFVMIFRSILVMLFSEPWF